MSCTIRTGNGFDVHKLVPGRPLIIGGVEIPFDMGLEGHSDADVLTHALMDALLGACALGDIGVHFPPDDDKWLDADSINLLKQVTELVENEGFVLVNADCTLIAQRPKMSPHIPEMRRRLAEACKTDIKNVSVKATTTEGLGFCGRGEGIAAFVSVLIEAKIN